MDFIKYLRNASFEIKYLILVLSVISGITGGALLILYPNAALHIFEKGKYLYYLLILPPVSCIFLISKRLSQSKTAEATEHALENQILTILNTIRQDELVDFEKRDRADIYLSIVNASAITQAATKSIDAFTHNITLIIGWLYIYFFLAPFLGWLIVIWRLIYVMFRESFQKIIKSILIEELKEQKDLFHVFQNHLFGFKELKFHRKKNEDIFNNYLCVIADRIKNLRIKARFYA
ncbi:MAG: ABC transporter transmembrane domain-containing protein, partial [Desulfosalsimonadaceae bacterium]|nr:ABC transporter transmembrane domain-containing protein [Desulfosalsimonadaceae bacterium]